MNDVIINIYRTIFSRRMFYRFNYHVYKMSLRGLGVFNSEGNASTGETHFLQYLAKKIKVKTIFDVGANDGGYATEVRSYFPKAEIYSFEPHPLTFKLLQEKAKTYNLKTYNYAVGSGSERVLLWDFADDAALKDTQPTSALASIHKDVIENFHHQKAQSFEVKQIKLDSFVKKNKINEIDFLKIDTEGYEYEVLKGAKKLIEESRIHVIQFEFNEMNAYGKIFLKDFVDILDGYTFYRLMPKGFMALKTYRPITHEIFGFQNIIAVSKKYQKYFSEL